MTEGHCRFGTIRKFNPLREKTPFGKRDERNHLILLGCSRSLFYWRPRRYCSQLRDEETEDRGEREHIYILYDMCTNHFQCLINFRMNKNYVAYRIFLFESGT